MNKQDIDLITEAYKHITEADYSPDIEAQPQDMFGGPHKDQKLVNDEEVEGITFTQKELEDFDKMRIFLYGITHGRWGGKAMKVMEEILENEAYIEIRGINNEQ